jgi:hypothetical protein
MLVDHFACIRAQHHVVAHNFDARVDGQQYAQTLHYVVDVVEVSTSCQCVPAFGIDHCRPLDSVRYSRYP